MSPAPRHVAQPVARSAFPPAPTAAFARPFTRTDAPEGRIDRKKTAAHRSRPHRFALLAALIAGMAASGCGLNDPNRSGLLEPYRVDLPQGNYLTSEDVDRVEKGMSPEQVRFVLGTPLLRDLFHPDRWDYLFRYRFPNGTVEQRKVTIHFHEERVVAIEADALPAREDASDPALPGYRPDRSQARSGSGAEASDAENGSAETGSDGQTLDQDQMEEES